MSGGPGRSWPAPWPTKHLQMGFLRHCHEKLAPMCHAERQRSIRGDQVVSLAHADASLPLSMTRERVLACSENPMQGVLPHRKIESIRPV
jgi:hypothetical protein